MSEDNIRHVEDAILRHLRATKNPVFIGSLVRELQGPGLSAEALRAAVWLMASEGKLRLDHEFTASVPVARPRSK